MGKAGEAGSRGKLQVRFWGVRGSFPVSGEGFLHYGGNTSCVEVAADGHRILCDMGTGMIKLGNHLLHEHLRSGKDAADRDPIEAVVLVSHAHHDHTQGFPFFKPAYIESSSIHIFGPRVFNEDWRDIMARAMMAPLFPVDLADMHSRQVIKNIEESEIILIRRGEDPMMVSSRNHKPKADGSMVAIKALKNLAHPKGGVVNYRIEFDGRSVVYATDVEGYVGGDARLVAFAKGADLLIHDAQYLPAEYTGLPVPTQGFGHSTYEMAAAVAKSAGVKSLALFHHDPAHTDSDIREIERQAKAIFPATFAAYEGQEVSIP